MLQVEPMSFCNLLVYCTFDPGKRIHDFVVPVFKHFYSERKLSIDCPDQKEPILLKSLDRNILNSLVAETIVLDGDSSRGLGGAELPWRIHHDDIKSPLSKVDLALDQAVPVEVLDVCTDGYGLASHT